MKSRNSSWVIYIDGASLGNPGRSGAGMVGLDDQGEELWREGVHLGEMTNNMAEYEALVRALLKARDSSVSSVVIYTDSLLVANQIKGLYKVKNSHIETYVRKAMDLIKELEHFDIRHIGREQNRLADRLAKQAAENKG